MTCSNKTSDAKQSNIIKKQQKNIEELLDRLGRLEGTVAAMEGELAVIRNVNMILSQQLDEADQYSRRSCMIVTGLRKPEKDETNDEYSKRVISAIAREAGLDEGEFMRRGQGPSCRWHEKWQTIKNYQIHYPQF